MKPPLPQWALAFTTRDCKEASVPGRWGNAVGMGHVRSCAARLSPFTALGWPNAAGGVPPRKSQVEEPFAGIVVRNASKKV